MRIAWTVLVLAGCGGSIEPKLSSIQEKVFTLTCATAGCHTTAGDQLSQLDLSAGNSFKSLVNVAARNSGAVDDKLLRVKPGDPDHSLLVIKIAGHTPVGYGTPMPQSGAPVSAEDVSAIRTWITNGALDN
jgi:hypothetical protein